MNPYQFIVGGNFIAPSSLHVQLPLSDFPDEVFVRCRNWGNDVAVTAVESRYFRGMAMGSAKTTDQAVTTGALSSNSVSTLGISLIDTSNPPVYAPLATTGISGNTGAFVVLMANTGSIGVGDWVRIINPTGELQIGGVAFQVTAVTVNTSITLGYMASSGITFAAAATAGSVLKFFPNLMYPNKAAIANITAATQAVVYFTGTTDFVVGQFLTLVVPQNYGMTQANGLTARILSVTNSSSVASVTLDLDTSGFSAFTYPTSAQAANGISPAQAVPAGSGIIPFNGSATTPLQPVQTTIYDAFDNRNRYLLDLNSNVITVSGATYDWYAIRYDSFRSA